MPRCLARFVVLPLMVLALCLAACSDGPDSLAPDSTFLGKQHRLLDGMGDSERNEVLRPLEGLFREKYGNIFADDRSMGTTPMLLYEAIDNYRFRGAYLRRANGNYARWAKGPVLSEAPVEFYRAYIRFLREAALPGARDLRAFLDVFDQHLGPGAKAFTDISRDNWDLYISYNEKMLLPALEIYLKRAEEAVAKNPARPKPLPGIPKADLDPLLNSSRWEEAGVDLPAFDRSYLDFLSGIPDPALDKITASLERHMVSEPEKAEQYTLLLAMFRFWADHWKQQVRMRYIAWDLFEAIRDKTPPDQAYSLGACLVLGVQELGVSTGLPLLTRVIFPDIPQGRLSNAPGKLPEGFAPSLPEELMPLMREVSFIEERDDQRHTIISEMIKLQPELKKY